MKRWNQHLQNAKTKSGKGCHHFWNAIRKYGKDAFSHHVLGEFNTLEAGNAAEEKWIEILGSQDPQFGFNLEKGGSHTPHPIRNPWDRPEYREKAIIATRKKWDDLEMRARHSDAVKKSFTPARRDTASQQAKKQWEDSDSRLKGSEASRKKWEDPNFRATMSQRAKEQWRNPNSRLDCMTAARKRGDDMERNSKLKKLWEDQDFRARCSVGLEDRNAREAAKTHCKHGHEFTPNNTYHPKRGGRECRACNNQRRRKKPEEYCPTCP